MSNVESLTSKMQLCDQFQYTVRKKIWEIFSISARISNKIYKKYLSSELVDIERVFFKSFKLYQLCVLMRLYFDFRKTLQSFETSQIVTDQIRGTKILKPFLVVYHSFCSLFATSDARANLLQCLLPPFRIENILPDEKIE